MTGLVSIYLTLQKTAKLVSILLCHFPFPLAVCERFDCSTSCQHLVWSAFVILTPLVDMWCYLIAVLICVSLVTNDVGYLFVYLLAVCISSLSLIIATHPRLGSLVQNVNCQLNSSVNQGLVISSPYLEGFHRALFAQNTVHTSQHGIQHVYQLSHTRLFKTNCLPFFFPSFSP